jgi:hypothetical protein
VALLLLVLAMCLLQQLRGLLELLLAVLRQP